MDVIGEFKEGGFMSFLPQAKITVEMLANAALGFRVLESITKEEDGQELT